MLLSGLSLFIAAVWGYGTRGNSQEFTLTILHSNDLHAHDLSFTEHGRSIGGMARIAHLIEAIKTNNHDAVAVDAGDFFQGTTMYQRYRGEVEVDCLNKAGYDIATLGNHEFDDGPANLAKQLKRAQFSIISSNLDFSKEPELNALVKPAVVKTVKNEPVVFIGAITPDLEHLTLRLGKVDLKAQGDAWIKPIGEEVDHYKQEGINKIVLVTHCGVEADKQLAQTLGDVDVIVGGHSHTRLDTPIWVEHGDGTKTMIVQTGCYGRALGKLDLVFDDKGHLVENKTQYHLINITDRIKEDPAVVAYLDQVAAPLLAMRQEIVGYSEGVFDNRFNTTPWDSSIGDLISDAIADEGAEYGATIAFQNRGGIRARIDVGPVSEEKVRELLPFDNKVVLATISGECLRKTLERSVSGMLGGPFLDVHGIKFGYDPGKPKGERIVFALAQGQDGKWQAIDPNKSYKIVTNDYTFKGGEGYDFAKATDVTYLPDHLYDAFHKYLVKQKKIRPELANRIVPLTSGLLEVKNSAVPGGAGKETLVVHPAEPGCKSYLVLGRDLGVEALTDLTKNPIPVPVEGATVLKRASSGKGGATSALSFDLSKFSRDGEDSYAVAVCRHPSGSSSKAPQISYPLAIHQDSPRTR
jgi:5'-nucleotidase